MPIYIVKGIIMSDGRIDRQFIIKKGGITQGIAQELGLSNDECKQISGSIWSQVINEIGRASCRERV